MAAVVQVVANLRGFARGGCSEVGHDGDFRGPPRFLQELLVVGSWNLVVGPPGTPTGIRRRAAQTKIQHPRTNNQPLRRFTAERLLLFAAKRLRLFGVAEDVRRVKVLHVVLVDACGDRDFEHPVAIRNGDAAGDAL